MLSDNMAEPWGHYANEINQSQKNSYHMFPLT